MNLTTQRRRYITGIGKRHIRNRTHAKTAPPAVCLGFGLGAVTSEP
jgi:hypothetical protein